MTTNGQVSRGIATWVLSAALVSCAEPGDVRETARTLQAAIAAYRQGAEAAPGPIEQRMRELGVPGASVAVIDDYRIDWARGFGVAHVATPMPVTPTTLFQAASISKSVAAVGILSLVERGSIELDDDVNELLTNWKIPAIDGVEPRAVTLRRLLNHTGGLTVHGFRGYRPHEPRPTVLQTLDGERPANNDPVRIEVPPGTRWQYSGGGYTVLQLAVTDLTGEPFEAFMRQEVLDPLEMTRSNFRQPLPSAAQAEAAVGHDRDGRAIPGLRYVYPELAAAGLWTTPSDLARFTIEIQLSLEGRSHRVLRRDLTRIMLTAEQPAIGLQAGPLEHDYGLGLALIEDGKLFGHGGSNAGFQCMLLATREGGQGVVVMTNGDRGAELYEEIVTAVRDVYGW
jgi:CubicO group peptidase (beta-lactamase class C family)